MKKLIILILIAVLVFVGFINIMWYLLGGNVYSLEGSVENAILDSNGGIIINEEDITEVPTYIVYRTKGIAIGLIAIRNSEGKVLVVINKCNSCEDAPNSYYILKDKKFQCKLCSNKIAIDDLDKDGDCYPIKVEERKDEDGQIIIGTKQLKDLKDRFKNWGGPTI